MTKQQAQTVLDKIIGQIFGYKNGLSLEQFMQKYCFDIRLPNQVNDSTTGKETWAQSSNPTKFITVENAWAREDWSMMPRRDIKTVEDILVAWEEVNYTATERYLDSANVAESDNIYESENVYRSQDIHTSKNILFSDGVWDSEFLVATQRSNSSAFCGRLEDSTECSNSFEVSWSKKITNSFFIHDSADLIECMFCSHITSKQYCIANMQFKEDEYMKLKDEVVRWILTN
ncbi:MAG TPA: hypothetical protein VMT23_03515 [Candidatus Binatia bacterium]|nr:hypothetical protein [Candidatus Binatia bacterium]